MKIRLLMQLAIGCLGAAQGFAGTIYELVDYPDLQNGNSLSGLIEVTDDAADDGVLDQQEVVGWSWTFRDQPYFARFPAAGGTSSTPILALGIEIDQDGIYLPAVGRPAFWLEEVNAEGVGFTLSWAADEQTIEQELIVWTPRDAFAAWITAIERNPPSVRWKIARVVPEPSTFYLVVTKVCYLIVRRRHFGTG